jgi:peptide/nickel transport system ATP-binding protein
MARSSPWSERADRASPRWAVPSWAWSVSTPASWSSTGSSTPGWLNVHCVISAGACTWCYRTPYQSLHPGMRVCSAIAEPLEIAGTGNARSSIVGEALEEVGLTPASSFLGRYPHQLSGGQRQRVVLARALVGRPRLVVADEPTSMVDATLRGSIVQLIRDLRDHHGIAFLVITHDLDMAGAVGEQVAVMQHGRLVECGRTAEVFHSPKHPYTKMLLHAAAEVGRLEVAE